MLYGVTETDYRAPSISICPSYLEHFHVASLVRVADAHHLGDGGERVGGRVDERVDLNSTAIDRKRIPSPTTDSAVQCQMLLDILVVRAHRKYSSTPPTYKPTS